MGRDDFPTITASRPGLCLTTQQLLTWKGKLCAHAGRIGTDGSNDGLAELATWINRRGEFPVSTNRRCAVAVFSQSISDREYRIEKKIIQGLNIIVQQRGFIAHKSFAHCSNHRRVIKYLIVIFQIDNAFNSKLELPTEPNTPPCILTIFIAAR